MPTFKIAPLLAGLALAGCMQNPLAGMLGRGPSGAAEALHVVQLRRAVTVDLPEGWCADGAASRLNAGFALVAGCQRIQGAAAETPAAMAALQLGPAGSAPADLAEIEAVFETPAGRALLADQGNPDHISALRIRQSDTALMLRYDDAGLGTRVWRAILAPDGALMSVAVRALPDEQISTSDGEAILIQLLSVLE